MEVLTKHKQIIPKTDKLQLDFFFLISHCKTTGATTNMLSLGLREALLYHKGGFTTDMDFGLIPI